MGEEISSTWTARGFLLLSLLPELEDFLFGAMVNHRGVILGPGVLICYGDVKIAGQLSQKDEGQDTYRTQHEL